MKKVFNGLMLILFLLGIVSCKNEFEPENVGNYRNKSHNPIMKTVRMSFGGDFVSESEESLMRADENETYVIINVYRTEKNKENASQFKYAYGLFKGKDEISIDLVTGYTYYFCASILIEDRDKVELLNGKFQEPFLLKDDVGVQVAEFFKDNKKIFKYHDTKLDNNERTYFTQLKSGTAYVNPCGDIVESNGSVKKADLMRYPRVKRFYGELSDFDPAVADRIDIPMSYKSFGIKFLVEKIPDGTYLTVQDITSYTGSDPGDNRYLLFPKDLTLGNRENDQNSWEGIFSLNDLKNDSRTFKLQFTWHKLSGSPESFTHSFEVHAKKLKVLKINVEGYAGELTVNKPGNIYFTMDDSWDETGENEEETVSN